MATLLRKRATQFPVVQVSGPRQAGKTTLCRACFAGHAYISLESPDVLRQAREDPRGFLRAISRGAILDEVQNAPALLSYLQAEVDQDPRPGRFILTGSQHLALTAAVTQSLAGRVAVLELLPFSYQELRSSRPGDDVWTVVWRGGYPALLDRPVEPYEWLSSYVATYVERDARQILNVTDLTAFQTFVQLAASRTAQMLDHSRLGADVGITHNTAKKWFSVLEASYLCFRLPPFFRNIGKRLAKTPKGHFFDSGLVCYLLGIRSPEQLRLHPLRGPIFESWVISEIVKAYANQGERPTFTYFRDKHGLEVDAVIELGLSTCSVEIKSSETVPEDAFVALDQLSKLFASRSEPVGAHLTALVHAGASRWDRRETAVLPWSAAGEFAWPGLKTD